MGDARDAPPQMESGGLLEIVDMMCSVTDTLSQIVRRQAEALERAKVEESVRRELREAREDADGQLDRIEIKLRRII